jgi:hypothetical protein
MAARTHAAMADARRVCGFDYGLTGNAVSRVLPGSSRSLSASIILLSGTVIQR